MIFAVFILTLFFEEIWTHLITIVDIFSYLYFPPAYKGAYGVNDTGYGVYDHYDLGEFKSKNTIRTKYGTKKEYLWCIKMFHLFGIDVYADIVLNHLMGADVMEQVIAYKVDAYHRHKVSKRKRAIRQCH